MALALSPSRAAQAPGTSAARARVGTAIAPAGTAIAPAGKTMAAPRCRWLACGFAVAGIGLLPWMVYLAVSLPASTQAWHWPAAWIGLDLMEAAGLLATGILLLRGDVRYCLTALPTAGVLLSDAWFDCATAPPGGGELASVAMALAAELPAAALCLIIGAIGLRRLLGSRPSRAAARRRAPGHDGPRRERGRQRPSR